MTKAYILDFEGGGAEAYDAVLEDMGLAHGEPMPAGAQFHGAGEHGGGWRVIDVWDDPDAFDRFAAESIGPLSAKHGLGPPQVEVLEVDEVRRGSDGDVSFMQVVRLPGIDRAAFKDLDARVVPGDVPADLVFHVNGPSGDGWMVIDYWTSKSARDEFLENNIKPAVQAAGVTSMPDFADTELHNSMRASHAHA